MNLKADGDKLSGTVSGRNGDTDISEGKSMATTCCSMWYANSTQHYSGKLNGDTIHFTIKMEGGMGGGQDRKMDVKRATAS